jgi:hypothetical protein
MLLCKISNMLHILSLDISMSTGLREAGSKQVNVSKPIYARCRRDLRLCNEFISAVARSFDMSNMTSESLDISSLLC